MKFTVYCHPEPQGSSKGFLHKATGRVIVTSDNAKLKPYRQAVTQTVLESLSHQVPVAAKHVPVWLILDFYFSKPASVPKKREYPVVRPDADKVLRATLDALTGVLYYDDAQVVDCHVRKFYDAIERVEIEMHTESGLSSTGFGKPSTGPCPQTV